VQPGCLRLCLGREGAVELVAATEDAKAVEAFLRGGDSACMFHNASMRFADGFRWVGWLRIRLFVRRFGGEKVHAVSNVCTPRQSNLVLAVVSASLLLLLLLLQVWPRCGGSISTSRIYALFYTQPDLTICCCCCCSAAAAGLA
jgi:hypothetical protein